MRSWCFNTRPLTGVVDPLLAPLALAAQAHALFSDAHVAIILQETSTGKDESNRWHF
jgi:hypothetical protein